MAVLSSNVFSSSWQVLHDSISGLLAHPAGSTTKWIFSCLDEKTECLTEHGWKQFSQLTKDDFVLTYNLSTKKSEFKQINLIHIYDFTGNLLHFSSGQLDMMLTGNHRCLIKKRRSSKYLVGREFFKESIALKNCDMVIQARELDDKQLPQLSHLNDDFVRLIGWIITEGHFYDNNRGISIYQSEYNKKYVLEIRNILQNLGLKYSEYSRFRENSQFRQYEFYIHKQSSEFIIPFLKTKRLELELVLGLNNKQRKLLIDTLMKGDGSKMTQFYQKDKVTCDNFQIMCLLCGIKASVRKKGENIYTVYVSKKKDVCIRDNIPRKVPYNGKVWCLTVDNANFMVRRQGIPFFTGNSFPDVRGRSFPGYPIVTVSSSNVAGKRLTLDDLMDYDLSFDVTVFDNKAGRTDLLAGSVWNILLIKKDTLNASGLTHMNLVDSPKETVVVDKDKVHFKALSVGFKLQQ